MVNYWILENKILITIFYCSTAYGLREIMLHKKKKTRWHILILKLICNPDILCRMTNFDSRHFQNSHVYYLKALKRVTLWTVRLLKVKWWRSSTLQNNNISRTWWLFLAMLLDRLGLDWNIGAVYEDDNSL